VDDVGLDQGGTQGSGFAVGPLPAIAARRYVAKGLALAAGASLAALALYFGLAWARRRQATYAREFAAFMLLFGAPFLAAGLHALTWLRTPGGPCVWSAAPMPIETPPSFVVGSYWMVAVTLTLVRFFKHFFGLPSRWFYRGVHAVAGAELAALAVCGGFDFARLFNRYHFVFLLAVVFPYLAWRLGQATRQGDRRVKRLAVAAFAGIFTASLAAVLYSRQVVDVPLDLTIPACVLLFVAAVAWEARRRLRDEAVDEPTTPVRA
jgi:hypothetical protein